MLSYTLFDIKLIRTYTQTLTIKRLVSIDLAKYISKSIIELGLDYNYDTIVKESLRI
jgi:hypothetical protein